MMLNEDVRQCGMSETARSIGVMDTVTGQDVVDVSFLMSVELSITNYSAYMVADLNAVELSRQRV